MDRDSTTEVIDLLQQLIRNACVNDGSAESGYEARSVDLLRSTLEGPGLDLETFEPMAGRASLVARIEGSDPSAPTVLLMGHTDVVPANPHGWDRDPFAADLVDGEIWGRGAIDMLNLTASMAVATRRLARSGWRPKGSLVYLAVADEEALGTYGAEWLTNHASDAVAADYVITESGGIPMPTAAGVRLPVIVGEKGTCWCRLTVAGTPGHGSQPFRTDNAIVTAAEVVHRLASYQPDATIHETWRRFVEGMAFPPEIAEPLLDPATISDFCHDLPLGLARQAHACTHTTIAPTVVHGGVKTNVIPDRVDLDLDIRTLPGQTRVEVLAMLEEALGDLNDRVTVTNISDDPSSASPVETPLWDALQRVASRLHPGAGLVPFLTVGATDARFFRRLGVPSYGFGLFSERLTFEQYATMFHGDNERVDVDSLQLSTELWESLARDVLLNPV
ncbi:MAG TPA: M20/M25/M40 family metallo-hydrolase [Acidimicrobiales bacterium]|nr:M20/M25/M40 family metallo-hydrolase [Acidimicrobiales bacterium]